MLFGYARVSTTDQNPDHQIDSLLRAGVAQDTIYVDRASGAKASRPQLDELLKLLRDGDTLKITRLDRLGRSVLHLVTLGAKLRERGVGLHVIEQGIDTATAECLPTVNSGLGISCAWPSRALSPACLASSACATAFKR